MRRMTAGWRRKCDRRRGEAGFTLVEVVVAMAIFAMMVPATVAVLTRTTGALHENRSRIVAASLAASQMEQVRSKTASNLPDGVTNSYACPAGTTGNANCSTTVISPDTKTYTIRQTVSTTDTNGSTQTCASSTTDELFMYKLISLQVSWPNMGAIQPVRSDTLVRADSTAGTGSLAVTVRNSSGIAQANIPVTLNGTIGTTNSSGCVIFSGLTPATSYPATVNSAGYIGPTGTQFYSTPSPPVIVDKVVPFPITYDIAMNLTINYTAADGSALSAAQLAEVPADFRTGNLTSSSSAPSKPGIAVPGSAGGLNASTWTLKSGAGSACTLGAKDMSSGTPTAQTLNVPTASVSLSNLSTFAAIGSILAFYEGPVAGSGVTCPIGTSETVGTVFSLFGDHSAQLPLGQWRLQFPWNPLGFIPIPGLTVFCIDLSLTLTSITALLVDVGDLISKVITGILTGGGC